MKRSFYLNYSALILFLKIFFPIIAIIILGVLFIIPPEDNFGESVSVTPESLKNNLSFQINDSTLRGISNEGYKFDFKAKAISPAKYSKNDIYVQQINGQIIFSNETFIKLSAQNAILSSDQRYLDFYGNLKINTKDSLSIFSDSVRLDINEKTLSTDSEVTLTTPTGSASSGKMKIKIDDLSELDNTLIYLENNVKMSFEILRTEKNGL